VPRCVGCHKLSDGFKTCKTCKAWLLVDYVQVTTAYEGVYEELIHAMKFDNKRQATQPIADLISENTIYKEKVTVCPVPTAVSRIRQRGFDHINLISNRFSNNLKLECERILERKSNARQYGSSRNKRLNQLENEFYVSDKHSVEGKDVILIDDVVTTGATLSSCTKVLKKAGAKSVSAVVFAQKV
jgi:ComF family protein